MKFQNKSFFFISGAGIYTTRCFDEAAVYGRIKENDVGFVYAVLTPHKMSGVFRVVSGAKQYPMAALQLK